MPHTPTSVNVRMVLCVGRKWEGERNFLFIFFGGKQVNRERNQRYFVFLSNSLHSGADTGGRRHAESPVSGQDRVRCLSYVSTPKERTSSQKCQCERVLEENVPVSRASESEEPTQFVNSSKQKLQ